MVFTTTLTEVRSMINNLFFRVAGVTLFLLTGLLVSGQQTTVLVLDAKTKEPVPFANVCFEGLTSAVLKYSATDLDGKAVADIKETSKIAISYVGYEVLKDTIQPGETIKLSLLPKVLAMNEIVVTAQMIPERADKSIYKINVINSRQIELKAATNLTDLLSSESNMRISQDGVLGASISLQGLTGENVKILVDGVPIIGRLNGNIDLSQLNLYNIDHVEIIEGPMSVIYGSNAIAGVINLITKENKISSFSGYGSSYLESVGVYNFNAGASIRRKRNSFSLDLARNFFDGYTTADSLRSMQWKPRRQYNADGYYLYSGDKTRLKFSVQFFDEMIQDKGNLKKPYYETALDSYFHTLRQTSKVEATFKVSEFRQISLVGAYSSYLRKREVFFNDLTILEKQPAGGDTTVVSSYLARALYSRSYSNQKLNYQVGFDGSYEQNDGERIAGGSQRIGDYAAFISLKYLPVKVFSLQPGVRFIYNTKYNAPLVYSLNAKYSPTEHTSVRASYARGFRSPSIKELYLDFVDINHNLHGNPDLEAEYSHNVNLNFSYNRETSKTYLNCELGLFYNYVDNTIWLFQEGADITTYTYGNISKFISKGFQTNGTVSFYPALTLKAGLAHTGRKFPESGTEAEKQIFHYSTDFNAMATYSFQGINTSFTVNYKYTGRYPQLTPDSEFSNNYITGYSNLDVTIIKSFFQNSFSIALGGKNLLDVKDVKAGVVNSGAHSGGADGSSRVAWGRTVFVKLTYNFKKF